MSQSELPYQTADQIHPEAEGPPNLPETPPPPPPPPPGELEVSEMTEISESVNQGANQNRAETVLDLSRDTLGDNTSTNAALAEVQSETSFSTDRRAWLLCFICLELASGEKMSCCKNFTCYMCFKLHVKTQISGGRFEITCPFCDKSVQQSVSYSRVKDFLENNGEKECKECRKKVFCTVSSYTLTLFSPISRSGIRITP